MNEEKQHNTEKRSFWKRLPWLGIAGAVVGALGGYIYYIEIGCNSGSCAITSNPWMSMLWGAAMGYLLFDLFSGKRQRS